MADEPDMEFLMLLANIIVCLQLNFALYNTLMSSYRRQIAVLRSLVLSGPSPGPIRARRLSGNDKKQAWLLKQTYIHTYIHRLYFSVKLFSYLQLIGDTQPNPPCQLSLWEETGVLGENPRPSAER